MGRNAWALIKADKNFNVHIYRRGLTFLILSLLLSGALGGVIAKIYLNEPERDYYATSGITPPIKLTPMLTPNMSSQALLDPDPIVGTEAKVIPQ
jgi:intracellular multiplication protein IcmM